MCSQPPSKSAKYKLLFLPCWGYVLQRLSSDCHACKPYAAAFWTHSGAQKADFRRQATECARRRGESASAAQVHGHKRAECVSQAK